MPRGARDEEFHTAIPSCSPTGARRSRRPVVESAPDRLPAPTTALTLAIRDFLDRIGMPGSGARPRQRGRAGGPGRGSASTTPRFPVVERWDGDPVEVGVACATSRCRSTAAPTTSRSTPWSTSPIVGAGPAGLAAAVYGASEGLTTRGDRGRGDRRPGRHQLDDPQLPRLPARHLRHAAGPAGPQPGDPLRHPVLHRLAGRPRSRSAATASRTCVRTDGGDVRARAVVIASGVTYRKLGVDAGRRRWSAAASTTAPR